MSHAPAAPGACKRVRSATTIGQPSLSSRSHPGPDPAPVASTVRREMENPHAERQNVLLQRIIKNADKCTEAILELNRCLEEIIQADAHVKTAADLVTKYRKNVQYNLDATRAAAPPS